MTHPEFCSAMVGLKPRLLKYAMNLTRDRGKAPDLVQDTYLKAFTSMSSCADFSNLNAWVFKIMKNTFINNYRHLKRKNSIIDHTQDLFYINQSHEKGYISPESIYFEGEIVTCIDSLQDEFRVPIRMVIDGYKYKEISDKCGVKIGTIKSRIFISRQKLMLMLKDYPE